MFAKGDKIIYGQTGVCLVIDICEKVLIKNQKRLYYVLKPIYQPNSVIYAPTDSDKVFIRPIMTADEAEALILKMPKIEEKMKKSEHTLEECRIELASHNYYDLAALTAKIYQKKKAVQAQKKKLGFQDEKYMHLAETLLFGELAAALEIPVDEIQSYIKLKLNK